MGTAGKAGESVQQRMTARVTVEDVERVAELAHLELEQEETPRMLHDLNAILDYVAELNELDITLPEEGRRAGEVVGVHLGSAVTEVGTLEVQAISLKDSSRWKIEFDVRAGD